MYNWFEPLLIPHLKHHNVSRQSDEEKSSISMKKPPVLFKRWLKYHRTRDTPIKAVDLSASEKQKDKKVDEILSLAPRLNLLLNQHNNYSF